ncbi:amyloid beta precursor protein binding family B member 3 [Phyllostomus discolor]|uniref:Amyloid beta protein binding family B member 3 n=1 Tax=Phyllostomus discolor TaxID=89673 RepID=A0A833YTU8_9CHIR|nr:amyloid beta precursor protein binding family B member 3 [Phyllostomus discolor]
MWEGAGSEAAREAGAGWYWLPYLHSPLPVPQASCTVFQILSERVGVGGDSSCCSSDAISPEDLPRQVELLDAVSQAAQKYEALYMGTLPVTKAMGMDVLNEAIGVLTTRGDRDAWVPAMLSVSDSLMTAHPIQVPEGEVGGCGEVGRAAEGHCLLLEELSGPSFCLALW